MDKLFRNLPYVTTYIDDVFSTFIKRKAAHAASTRSFPMTKDGWIDIVT